MPHTLIGGIRLAPGQRRTLWALVLGLGATGVAWMWIGWGLAVDALDPVQLHMRHPLMVTHGTLAIAACFALGSLYPQHMRWAWRLRRSAYSGLLAAACGALLAACGALLYYAADERLRGLASLAHQWTGIGFCIVVPLHIALARRAARRLASRADRSNPPVLRSGIMPLHETADGTQACTHPLPRSSRPMTSAASSARH